MDVDECKIGQWPNIAIDPTTGKHAATGEEVERPNIQGDGLRTACYDYEQRIKRLTAERDEFRKHLNMLVALIVDIARRKQPYPFNPEAPYTTLDMIGDYIDELRLELERMTDENIHLQESLRQKSHVCDIQRDSFRKMEVEIAELRHLALDMWRLMDGMRKAGRAPERWRLKVYADALAEHGIEAE